MNAANSQTNPMALSNITTKALLVSGAMMDKLTYAALKGMEADLSKLTII